MYLHRTNDCKIVVVGEQYYLETKPSLTYGISLAIPHTSLLIERKPKRVVTEVYTGCSAGYAKPAHDQPLSVLNTLSVLFL